VTIIKKQWINNDKYGLVTIIWLRNSKNVAPRELQKFLVNMYAPSLHRRPGSSLKRGPQARSNQTQQARAVKVHQSKIMQKPGFFVTDVAKEFAGC